MSTNILADVRVQPQQPSDNQLLFEARSGNQRAFGELCLRYEGMLKQRIFSIVRNREDTEDVLQETLLSAYQHLDGFRGTCKFSTWVMKIGINMSLLLLRKRRRLSQVSSHETDDQQTFTAWEFRDLRPDPEQCSIADQTLQTIRNAIQRLPPTARSVVDLYYRNEHRIKATASILGITEGAAKARMRRARHMLCRSLSTQWNPDEANHKRLKMALQGRQNPVPARASQDYKI